MNEEKKAKLDEILNEYDDKLQQAKQGQERRKTEEEVFLDEFKRLRKEVIRPVMVNISENLKTHGHTCQVHEHEQQLERQGRIEDAKITMNLYPAGIERSAFHSINTPSISFSAQVYSKEIIIKSSTIMPNRGGQASPRGKLTSDKVDTDTIETYILDFLKDVLT